MLVLAAGWSAKQLVTMSAWSCSSITAVVNRSCTYCQHTLQAPEEDSISGKLTTRTAYHVCCMLTLALHKHGANLPVDQARSPPLADHALHGGWKGVGC